MYIILLGLAKNLPPYTEKNKLHRLLGALFTNELTADEQISIIESEYNVEAIYETVNVATARWVECADNKKFEEFKRKNEQNLALDGGDNLTYIAPTMVNLNLAQERYPDVTFFKTREH